MRPGTQGSPATVTSIRLPAASSMAPPPSTRPVRISGPFTSRSSATGMPVFRLASRRRAMEAACDSWVPCAMLNRATFMPARSSSASTSTVSVDGPSVQTILVFRMARIISGCAAPGETDPHGS